MLPRPRRRPAIESLRTSRSATRRRLVGDAAAPSGRNQCAVQLSAPSIARVGSAGSAARELAALDAVGDERAHAALVAIALARRSRAQRAAAARRPRGARSRPRLRRAAAHVRGEHVAQPRRRRPTLARRAARERREHAIERAVLAEVEDLVLAAEVVVEVAGRQVGGVGDLAHAGGGEAAGAEHARGGAQDLDPAVVGADRTAVRKLNHRSIVADLRRRSTKTPVLPLQAGFHGRGVPYGLFRNRRTIIGVCGG